MVTDTWPYTLLQMSGWCNDLTPQLLTARSHALQLGPQLTHFFLRALFKQRFLFLKVQNLNGKAKFLLRLNK